MEYSDTIKLLRECDAGSKMAVTSIDEVLEKTGDTNLKQLLQESKSHHEELGNEIHELLKQKESQEKDPTAMAKGMSWMKTNMRLAMDNSDTAIAELITAGCDMGINSLYRYLNQYEKADHESRKLCEKLISIEDTLRKNLRKFL